MMQDAIDIKCSGGVFLAQRSGIEFSLKKDYGGEQTLGFLGSALTGSCLAF